MFIARADIAKALLARKFVESREVLRRTIVSDEGVERQFATAYRRTATGRKFAEQMEK